MSNQNDRFNELIQALKKRDFRLTPQRMELVRLIAESKDHPSAAALYSKIKSRFPTMSQATVYKTLNLLKEMNQVLEIDLREDSHYDGNQPSPHPHLICTRCGTISDGVFNMDQSSLVNLEQSSGFQIYNSQINFYGLCPACKGGM
jgi:Fur family peroxide stress response transcriptional regulator